MSNALCAACGALADGKLFCDSDVVCLRCATSSDYEGRRQDIAKRASYRALSVDHRHYTPEWFTGVMRYKLSLNSSKGPWTPEPLHKLFEGLLAELAELQSAQDDLPDNLLSSCGQARATQLILEAADVGNYAMMIADKVRELAAIDALISPEWAVQVQLVTHVD